MLGIIKKKACRKCGGDLSLECDIYGVYIQCIQCGANWNEEDIGLKPHDAEAMLKGIKVRQPALAANNQNPTRVSDGLQIRPTRAATPDTGSAKKSKRVVVPLPDNRLSHFPDL